MLGSRRMMKWAVVPAAFVAMAALMADTADARLNRGGGGFGSRGAKTYSTPPPTATAPAAPSAINKSMTQPGAATAATASAAKAATASASRWTAGSMFKGLQLGGLMGAAFASIFGVGALASMLGFLLQTALIVGLVMLVMNFFRRRSEAAAGPGNPLQRATQPQPQKPQSPLNTSYDRAGSAAGAAGGAAAASAGTLNLTETDFNAFERLLGDIQTAYSKRDLATIERATTPEMQSYFTRDLADDDANGVRNEISNVKLLQGDLSESWREAGGEYATVAMRYSLNDVTVDKASGRVVSGSRDRAEEITELWTFRRPLGAGTDRWELSAIQSA